MALVELDESNFAETIRDNKGLAVVEFWAPWCRLCKAIAPTLDKEVAKLEAQAEYANVTFYKVNFKENQRLAFRERVAALPTLHFYGPFASRRINRFTVKPTTVAKQLRKEARAPEARTGTSPPATPVCSVACSEAPHLTARVSTSSIATAARRATSPCCSR